MESESKFQPIKKFEPYSAPLKTHGMFSGHNEGMIDSEGYWVSTDRGERSSVGAFTLPRFVLGIFRLMVLGAIVGLSKLLSVPFRRIRRSVETTARARSSEAIDSMFAEAAKNEELLRATELEAITLESQLRSAGTSLPTGVLKCVKVFYATDRNAVEESKMSVWYGNKRGDRLRYGTCEVTLPEDHRMGKLESPSMWRLEVKPNQAKHVVFQTATEMPVDRFYDELRSDVIHAPSHEIFVFVHGFANSFIDAARKTAQLSYRSGI